MPKKPSKRLSPVRAGYVALKRAGRSRDFMGLAVRKCLQQLISTSLETVRDAPRIPLNCDTGKSFFSFKKRNGGKTRPVNAALFDGDLPISVIENVLSGRAGQIDTPERLKALYTMAISCCAAADFEGSGEDKKTPATYFEYLCAHLVSVQFGVNPKNAIRVLSLDINNELPTDFTFDLGDHKNKIHMPVKTSTRERVIQVWAHQRVIDGVFGTGRYKGILVCLGETNAKKPNGVTEVCLPQQWMIYQMFIAQFHRVYYFDLPVKYADLGSAYPFIQVKTFAEFFNEVETIATASPFS